MGLTPAFMATLGTLHRYTHTPRLCSRLARRGHIPPTLLQQPKGATCCSCNMPLCLCASCSFCQLCPLQTDRFFLISCAPNICHLLCKAVTLPFSPKYDHDPAHMPPYTFVSITHRASKQPSCWSVHLPCSAGAPLRLSLWSHPCILALSTVPGTLADSLHQ